IQLENLSLAPKEVAESIFKFIFGNQSLSTKTQKFLHSHMNAESHGEHNLETYKHSHEEFEAWRWKISEKTLNEVESNPSCSEAIGRMGHRIFNSLDNVRNRSIPLQM
ncbi:unnamed protein product, partial [Meganyctiphanes norvegica]